jgi:ribose 5-phosphate isomerase B
MHDEKTAIRIVEVFLTTDISGDERHQRRIDMITRYEQTGSLPATLV